MQDPYPQAGDKQPIFKAPFLAILVACSMPLLFWLQLGLPDQGMSMAFRPVELLSGHWTGLLTAMLLHGGWMHVMMNAVGALAFGTPVARLFARGLSPSGFVLLYIVSGVVGSLGFALFHWGSTVNLVGASGAVFGLIGASTRLPGPVGVMLPWNHPLVLRQSAAWILANIALGLIGTLPGLGGPAIAWEAHVFGFIFGLLAVGPLARLFLKARD